MVRIDSDQWAMEPEDLESVWLHVLIPRQKAEAMPEEHSRLDITIKKWRKKRSLNANAYMWSLCDEIGKAVGLDKEEVYKEAVRARGVSDSFKLVPGAAKRFINAWKNNGIGWVVEIVDLTDSEVVVRAYYGTSTYDTKQMADVIDWLIDEAERLNIDTATPEQRSLMLDEWRQAHE